jgi:hypothetical protein
VDACQRIQNLKRDHGDDGERHDPGGEEVARVLLQSVRRQLGEDR